MKIIFLSIFGCFFANFGSAEVPKSDEDQARLVSPKGQNEEGIRYSLDVLCRQQIKLFQVVSTSEFHEY